MSTYRQKFNLKHGFPKNASHSIKEIARLSGIKYSNACKIVRKGEGAYYSNPSSVRSHVMSARQWGKARLYASIHPGSKSGAIDKDLLF